MAKDVGRVTRILAKMDIRDTLKDLFERASEAEVGKVNVSKKEITKGQDVVPTTIKLIELVLENYDKAETEIIALVAALDGRTVKEIEELDFEIFMQMLVEVFSNVSFFKRAVGTPRG